MKKACIIIPITHQDEYLFHDIHVLISSGLFSYFYENRFDKDSKKQNFLKEIIKKWV